MVCPVRLFSILIPNVEKNSMKLYSSLGTVLPLRHLLSNVTIMSASEGDATTLKK